MDNNLERDATARDFTEYYAEHAGGDIIDNDPLTIYQAADWAISREKDAYTRGTMPL